MKLSELSIADLIALRNFYIEQYSITSNNDSERKSRGRLNVVNEALNTKLQQIEVLESIK